MPGRFDHKKHGGDDKGPGKEPERDKEDQRDAEGAEVEREQQRNRVQDQLGNQAILSMMGDMAGASGGVELEATKLVKPKAHEKDGVEHGGDDDADPGPITIHDLAQTWNPGMRRAEDRPSFLEPMPDDELPPEDEAFLARAEAHDDPLPEARGATLDGLLVPSPEVVRIALTAWARAAGLWAGTDLTWQILRRLIAPPVPALQDPHGRVLLSRSRATAIAMAMLLDGPTLRSAPDTPTATALGFALELAARRHRVMAIEVAAEATRANTLPVALDLFQEHHATSLGGRALPRAPTPGGLATLGGILRELARYEDEDSLVPAVAVAHPEADPDDPLGLDAVIDEMTGGRPDPDELLYDASIQTAERVASAAARSRVLFAGTGLAVAEVAALDSARVGLEDLEDAMAAFDRDVASCLQLLLEIARTAQRKAVPPAGLHAGLRRAAKSLRKLRDRGTRALVEVIWGLLPGDPDLEPPVGDIPDAVQSALSVGQPADALPWLAAQPGSLDRDTAVALTRALSGALPPDLVDTIGALRSRWRAERPGSLVGVALDVVFGALALFVGRLDEALRIADELLGLGVARGNGPWIAEGALLGMEVHLAAGDTAALEARRHRAGNLLHRLGDRGALSLLARWTPPATEDGFE